MNKISVVVIAKNESHIIGRMIEALAGLTDDIILVDSGSDDGTQEIAKQKGTRILQTSWDGFGLNKNKGIHAAKYDWILSLDADEIIDEVLKSNLLSADLADESIVYELRFNTYFGEKRLRFGEWGRNEKHVRLFNRKYVQWNSALVHENLIIPSSSATKNINGFVKHYTVKDLLDYSNKTTRYAMLNAEKYFRQGKKANRLKLYYGQAFSFAWNYVFRLGFLDGYAGFITAKMTAHYTLLKYARLEELWNQKEFQP